MGLREKLEAEAETRAHYLASRFPPNRCVACAALGVAGLRMAEFRWRKQVGRSPEHSVWVEHTSKHLLCGACLDELRRRRRWFWPVRYAGGIALAAAFCGVVTWPILILFMRLTPSEKSEVMTFGIAGALLLPVAWIGLRSARRFSVPLSLFDMTGDGWECRGVKDAQG